MPRPLKWRKVNSLPENDKFGPLNCKFDENNVIQMTVDEYETIRLIDLEGLNQEECASQMDIARTTVQGIYNKARRKLAESLVNGKVLLISGGEYKLCGGMNHNCGHNKKCGCGRCCHQNDEVLKEK